MDGLADDEFLGWFGMHLLAPSIYDVLDEMIRDDLRDNGEFQLTRAQEIQRQREGYLALEMTARKAVRLRRADGFRAERARFRAVLNGHVRIRPRTANAACPAGQWLKPGR